MLNELCYFHFRELSFIFATNSAVMGGIRWWASETAVTNSKRQVTYAAFSSNLKHVFAAEKCWFDQYVIIFIYKNICVNDLHPF